MTEISGVKVALAAIALGLAGASASILRSSMQQAQAYESIDTKPRSYAEKVENAIRSFDVAAQEDDRSR